jgi:hypothetical protein
MRIFIGTERVELSVIGAKVAYCFSERHPLDEKYIKRLLKNIND